MLDKRPEGRWQSVDELVAEIKELEPYQIQAFFDWEYDGGCPCFLGRKYVADGWVEVYGKCWRVSDNAQDLIVSGSLSESDLVPLGNAIKEKLDAQEWYSEYTIECRGGEE